MLVQMDQVVVEPAASIPNHPYQPYPLAPRFQRHVRKRLHSIWPYTLAIDDTRPCSGHERRFRDVIKQVLRSRAASLLAVGDRKALAAVSPVVHREFRPSDPQYIQTAQSVDFLDVALIVLRSPMSSVLDDTDFGELAKTTPVLERSNWRFLPTWVARPTLLLHHKRHVGFGQAEVGRSASHIQPNPLMFIHFVWNFLSVVDKGVRETRSLL